MSTTNASSKPARSTELEPQDLALREASRVARRVFQSVGDLVRVWFTRTLATLIVGSIGAGILDLISLPLAAWIATAAALTGTAGYAFYARRLMYLERRRRSWLEVQLLRERQRRLEAEGGVDVATLALATGDQRLLLRSRPRLRELLYAVRSLQDAAAERARAQPKGAELRRPAAPKPLETRPIERRIAQRELELREIDAEIQALANPTDQDARERAAETREQRRAAERAVMDADKEARARQRRGLPATAVPGTEMALEVRFGVNGVRDVTRPPARPTPEEIAVSPSGDQGENP